MMRGWFSPLVSLLVFLCLALQSTNSTDTIRQGHVITQPNTIMSSGGKFELGFFSPGNNSKYYLGIWHKVSKQAIVWIANRDFPILRGSSNLTINSEGQFGFSNGRMWYEVTNINTRIKNKTFATLLDSGNLILQDQISLEILWRSFDYPTDSILPGMNLGHDAIYGKSWSLMSWRSLEDPAPGSYSLGLNSDGVLVVQKDSKPYWNDSSLDFENYGGLYYKSFSKYGYASWGSHDTSSIMYMVLDVFGELMIQSWSEDDQSWDTLMSSKCSSSRCGAFSVCNSMDSRPCSCFKGFKPSSVQGCVRITNFKCNNSASVNIKDYEFYRMKIVNFPSDQEKFNVTSALACESACLWNCSCLAYSLGRLLF